MPAFRNLARRLAASGALLLAALPFADGTQAQAWPAKPVRLVYNFPAGSGGDSVTRQLADGLSKKLGQPFVVENRVGATGTVGAEAIAKATPDGYTFLTSPNAPLVLVPLLRPVPFAPGDLVPIAALGEYVYAWGVLPTMGPKTMAELVALAKTKPGQLTYSSSGTGSVTNLRGEVWKQMAGIDLTHVPYRAGNEAVIDFLGGRLDVMIDNAHFQHARAGKVLLLAMTSSRRHPDFPDVPTLAEAGYTVDLPTWLALYAVKGTPPEIVTAMGEAVRAVTATPEFEARLLQIGFFPMNQDAKGIAEMSARETRNFAEAVKKTGLKIE